MSAGEFLRAMVALAFTCGLLMVMVKVLSKARIAAGGVKLHGGLNFGGGKGIWLVEAMGKRFLIAVSDHAIQVLAEEQVESSQRDQEDGPKELRFASILDQVISLMRVRKG